MLNTPIPAAVLVQQLTTRRKNERAFRKLTESGLDNLLRIAIQQWLFAEFTRVLAMQDGRAIPADVLSQCRAVCDKARGDVAPTALARALLQAAEWGRIGQWP